MLNFLVIHNSIDTSLGTSLHWEKYVFLEMSKFKYFYFLDLANTHKHFGGAASCFSCRAFFRRVVRKKEPTKCQGGHQICVIDIKTRALCAYCRFQKCLSVGMDRQRVMKGEALRVKNRNR